MAQEALNPVGQSVGESWISMQADRVKPELRPFALSLNVYMSRFITVAR
jgi:hypothetical protein